MKKLTDKQMYWGGAALAIALLLYFYREDVKKFFSKVQYKAKGETPDFAALDRAKLLGIGDKGPEVAYLQSLMLEDGADLGIWGADGDFGPITLAALQLIKGVDETTINEYTGQPVRENRANYRA